MTIKKGTERDQIKAILEKLRMQRSIRKRDLSKYCGVLSLKQDPMELQNKWRDEW
ncbi:MAG: hypothetical protein PHQ11_15785 [Paludibacter sp.]|nr:hypothetical protein [Paludibacter sp.]MDD4428838.1 hypothetical protein [Paludibacter sp.]